MQIGTNLNANNDFSPAMAFADCMRSARAWGTANAPYDQKATLGPDGMPIGDFGAVVFTDVQAELGIYKLKFEGMAEMSCPGSNAKVLNKLHDITSNVTSADIQLIGGNQLFLAFKGALGVKNISLMRPGLTNQIFNPQFLADVKNYRCLRFMDWLHTNDSPIQKWADRKRPDEILQSGARGVALEYCIELCNQVGCDGWFNVPHMADDDYVTQMANLIKAKLDPNLKIYLEYSNEVWNSIFKQTEWNHQQAIKDVAAGQTDLQSGPTDSNTYYWGRRRVAKRIMQIGRSFKNIFGESTSTGRVRPVLASQAGDVSVGRAQLGFLSASTPKVSGEIYGLAIAPYFATQADDVAGATLQSVIDGINSSVKSNADKWIAQPWDGKSGITANLPTPATMAKFHGVKFLFYECGQHMLGATPAAQALDLQVQSTPEMGIAYKNYFAGMDGRVDLACHFVNMGPWGKSGYWGLTNSYANQTPKQQAVIAAAKAMNGPSMDELKAQILQLQSQIVALTQQVNSLQSIANGLQAKINSAKADVSNLLTHLS